MNKFVQISIDCDEAENLRNLLKKKYVYSVDFKKN